MAVTDFMKPFHIMTRTQTADGEGGTSNAFVQGAAVQIAAYNNQSLEAFQASKQAVLSSWSLVFDKSETALVHDAYVRRDSDLVCFRITSDPSDFETPAITALNLRKATAEKVVLPT